MKKLCKYLVLGGMMTGALIGGAVTYLSAVVIKNNVTVASVCKSKAKEAFKTIEDKFCL